MTMRRVAVDPDAPQRDAIAEAATWIVDGGVVAIPTDTLYGLAVDPFNSAAVARLFAVKGRDADRALPLVASDVEQVVRQLSPLTPAAERLAQRFWPGPLTLVLAAPVTIAAAVTGGTGRVGVRVPACDVTRAICRAANRPVTATSANISGAPSTWSPDIVEQTLGGLLDYLLDTGATPGGPPSTIVDLVETEPRLLRAGAIDWQEIRECLQHAVP
jgi:L-threonylcarbamoyladenylate synthase